MQLSLARLELSAPLAQPERQYNKANEIRFIDSNSKFPSLRLALQA
jgi:hypothetical protein